MNTLHFTVDDIWLISSFWLRQILESVTMNILSEHTSFSERMYTFLLGKSLDVKSLANKDMLSFSRWCQFPEVVAPEISESSNGSSLSTVLGILTDAWCYLTVVLI